MTLETIHDVGEYSRNGIVFKKLQKILSAIEKSYDLSPKQMHFQAYILEQLDNAVIATDIEGNIIYLNRFAQITYQWEAKEIIGNNICKVIISPKNSQLFESTFANLTESNVWQGCLIVQRKDGSEFMADVINTVIRNANGNVKGFVSISVDATERERAQRAWKQSEANLKAIFNSSLQAVILIDRERKIQNFNRTANNWAKKIYGESLKKNNLINTFITQEEANSFNRIFNCAIKGKTIKIEKCFSGLEKDYYWFEINYCPVFDDNGQVIGVCQVAINIDRHKKAIDEAAKSEKRFRSLVQNSSDIITVLEGDGNIRYVSPSVERILDYKPEDIIGKNAFDYIHPQERSTTQSQFSSSLKQPGVVVLKELRLRHGSGKWIYVEAAVNNLLDEASTKGVVVNCRDITDRKQAEAALRQQSLKEQALNKFTRTLRSYLDLETIGAIVVKEISQMFQADYVEIQQYHPSRQVWSTVAEYRQQGGSPSRLGVEVTDLDNEINRKLKQLDIVKITAVDAEDAEASSFLNPKSMGAWLLVPLHFQQRLWGSLRLMRAGNADEWQESEVELVRAIADQLAIAIQQAQLYQQSSALNADLECQVQERTAQLEQKVQELQQLNVLKDDFLSTVSHELRTPLANMKMAIQMLKIAPNSERRQRYLEILESECARETEMINDLLDLQRLEVAAYSIALETINLQDWLHSIIEPFVSRTQEHKQILQYDLPADLPPMVSDRSSLGRVLAELLNNACKYTPPGYKIILSVSYEPNFSSQTPHNSPVMTFTISNQAEIPAAELPRIFEKFYRVPNADPWKQGGTGLGLALVQQLIGKMEGTIEVKSSGGWTAFIIKIPARPSAQLRATGQRRLV
ncbi:MAG: PAS domain S-box protein [Aphanothece sp. CMT-3BRIN-NPC111]|jgi:PAS domain S-box-containing protein|nr:PAS domain S-box protein [Aphanothece sp. CMT-3BRIN-NPC111]